MPKMNFDSVKQAADYSPLPDGKYPIIVNECEEKQSHSGNEIWNIKMEVVEGEFESRRIFDNITWTDKAFPRTKLVLSRFGLSVKGEIDYEPEDLLEKTALVEVETEEYENEDEDGKIKKKRRNKVTFAGYEKWSPGEATPKTESMEVEIVDEGEETVPF